MIDAGSVVALAVGQRNQYQRTVPFEELSLCLFYLGLLLNHTEQRIRPP